VTSNSGDERIAAHGKIASSSRPYDPMSGTWPMVLVNVASVVLLTMACFAASIALADGMGTFYAYAAIGSVAIFVVVALPLRYFLLAQRREVDDREAQLVREADRREFEARLSRGLDMADDEPGALDVAVRAFGELAPEAKIELLIADSSLAHLSVVAESPDNGSLDLEGCSVATPKACPAVRMGHLLRFDHSDALDACPHLRGRAHGACGAVCTPVSIMGSTTGVLHAVHRVGRSPDPRTLAGLETVAQQLGGRIGLLNAMSQSQMQANTDPLTGLLNRRSLEHEVRALSRRGGVFSVVLADLDHFKQLNDAHGHDTGDRALRLFARTLRSVIRDGDLAARYGGEEFVLVLAGVDASGAVLAFDRVRLELSSSLSDGRIPAFTVSAGVADTAEAAMLDELIALADARLLRAKRNGRNQVLHSDLVDVT
jgi:diguanylate cyclase (GGDEF)-like protein